MSNPFSVQCFTQRTGLPIGSSPLWNPIHYVFKVLVAYSANYCHSVRFLIVSTILGYSLRAKADICGVRPSGFPAHGTNPSRRFLTHPAQSVSGGQILSGVGFVIALLSPSPPIGVPLWREYLGG
jgi:hypothetical protein